MSEKYLKASEIAKSLNVASITARKWITKGLFPNAKLEETVAGKIWLVPESDLKDFIKPEIGRPKTKKDAAAK